MLLLWGHLNLERLGFILGLAHGSTEKMLLYLLWILMDATWLLQTCRSVQPTTSLYYTATEKPTVLESCFTLLHGNLGPKTWDSPNFWLSTNHIISYKNKYKNIYIYIYTFIYPLPMAPDTHSEAQFDVDVSVVTASPKAMDLAHLEPLEPWLQVQIGWSGEHPGELLRKKF